MEPKEPEPTAKIEEKVEEVKVESQSEPKAAGSEAENPEQKDQGDYNINPNHFSNDTGKEVDYDHLIKQFGCQKLTPELIERFEKVIGKPMHHLIRRGKFVSHRDFDIFLDKFEKGAPIYLYTGRGPSSASMHMGHLLPFIVTKWLQDVFQCPTVIQLTDDEKYFYQKDEKAQDLEVFSNFADENAKDIIACGFDPELTFIFKDTEYIQELYPAVTKLQKALTYNQIKGIFGLTGSENIGKSAFPPVQAAPCISTSFPHTFGRDPKKMAFCLIPHGIDQDPYFRMTRDLAARLKFPKPHSIHSKFFPGLKGFHSKMSASDPSSAIFLTDTPKEIKTKINSFAFSGGKATVEEHRKFGADLEVDIPYNYLQFFLEDDKQLEEIGEKYKKGEMLTGEVKKILIDCITSLVQKHQAARSLVTKETLAKFMTPRLLKKL